MNINKKNSIDLTDLEIFTIWSLIDACDDFFIASIINDGGGYSTTKATRAIIGRIQDKFKPIADAFAEEVESM